MDWYGWRISFGTPANFNNKPDVAEECLALSLEARFPTDYTDVYEHLFGNDDYLICMLYNNNGNIMGYSIFANLKEIDMLYLHGIVLHPLAQGKGFSKGMIESALKHVNPKFLSARTHNPRMFETLSSFASNTENYYPNVSTDEIPAEVHELVKNNEFTTKADELLIVRNAYPDEKIAQSFKNEDIAKIFERLNPNDAQVIVVRL